VNKLNDVVFDAHAWNHLVLEADTKRLIAALVRVTDNARTASGAGGIIADVISGKGGGLISVLHGPPGTGKTLTAESVAEHLRRPLYMVGFSELTTTPGKLESALRRILSLATAWDAVLLIDEADVFLEQRSLHELERNALVSVALRLLEYHRGVLFLTTNRITTFDEAFLSRFSIAIKYHELDQAGRLAVWRKFFELAGCRIEGTDSEDEFTTVDASTNPISADDLDELSEKPFNGRTIKNLVRTAQALALSEGVPLNGEHVKTVVRVQEKFLREFAATKLT
jgi:SpoVK/Ycf46/Vps4 family AAA+-type ATPase